MNRDSSDRGGKTFREEARDIFNNVTDSVRQQFFE
jgi:hypothetical protein